MWDVRRLMCPMRLRCTALAQAAGGHTKYLKDVLIYFNDLLKNNCICVVFFYIFCCVFLCVCCVGVFL